MDGARLDLFTKSGLKEHSTDHTHTMETCSGVVHTGMCVYILVPSTQFNLIEPKKKILNKKKLLTQKTIYEQRMKKSSGKRSQRK